MKIIFFGILLFITMIMLITIIEKIKFDKNKEIIIPEGQYDFSTYIEKFSKLNNLNRVQTQFHLQHLIKEKKIIISDTDLTLSHLVKTNDKIENDMRSGM